MFWEWQEYHVGRLSEHAYLNMNVPSCEFRMHRQAHILMKKMYRCPIEQTDATACQCPDGFIAQVRGAN